MGHSSSLFSHVVSFNLSNYTYIAAAAVASVVSDSVRPHRQQPTRLPRPWDSPGKNTGVGCHFLLRCMKVKSESEVTQSCLTLRDPMDCSPPGFFVHGIFQARVLDWGAIAFSDTYVRPFNISLLRLCSLKKFPLCSSDCVLPTDLYSSSLNHSSGLLSPLNDFFFFNFRYSFLVLEIPFDFFG